MKKNLLFSLNYWYLNRFIFSFWRCLSSF